MLSDNIYVLIPYSMLLQHSNCMQHEGMNHITAKRAADLPHWGMTQLSTIRSSRDDQSSMINSAKRMLFNPCYALRFPQNDHYAFMVEEFLTLTSFANHHFQSGEKQKLLILFHVKKTLLINVHRIQ